MASGAPGASATATAHAAPSAAPAPAIDTALIQRDLLAPDADAEPDQPTADHPAQSVEPDLDALARQVYTMLRRRLAAERRWLT